MQWALIGAAAVFGIALALLAVVLAASRKNDQPDETPAQVAVAAEGQDLPRVEADSLQPAADTTPPPTPTAEAPATDAPATDAPAMDAPATEPKPGEAGAGKSPTAADTPQPKVPADGAAAEPTEPPTMDVPPAEPATTDGVPADENASNAEPPSAPSAVTPASPAGDAPSETEPGGAPVDPNSPLTRAVAAAEFEGVALLDFLQFFAEFTAIPVTVDFDAIRRAGLPYEAAVNLQLDATTAGQLLQHALDPLGLKFTFSNGQVVIEPAVDVNSEIQLRSYDVSDLAETPEQMAPLAALITAIVEPASWQEASGLGGLAINDQSLDVEQTMAVHFELARLLDRLRTARGLLPRSDLPRELLTNVPTFASLEATLQGKPLTLNFGDPTAITTILERLRSETELRLLVDWESTGSVGWKPDTNSTLSANDTAFAQLLDEWLAPQQLGFRIVDDRLIQIASLAALKERGEIEVYRLTESAAKTAETVSQGLKQELGEPAITEAGGAVVYEPASRCLVVRLPQPLQRRAHSWLSSQAHLEPPK